VSIEVRRRWIKIRSLGTGQGLTDVNGKTAPLTSAQDTLLGLCNGPSIHPLRLVHSLLAFTVTIARTGTGTRSSTLPPYDTAIEVLVAGRVAPSYTHRTIALKEHRFPASFAASILPC